jgi:hypothetical protein
MNRFTLFAAATFLTLLPRAGHADTDDRGSLGARSSAAIVVDGLFGFQRTHYGDPKGNGDLNTLSLGTQGNIEPIIFNAARVGIHGFAGKVFSIGANFRWWHLSSQSSITILGVAPRLGFVIPAGEGAAIWLRGGAGYENWDLGRDDSINFISVGAELEYVSTAWSHFGWTLGPSIETDVSSKETRGSSDRDSFKRTTVGIAFGVLFDF